MQLRGHDKQKWYPRATVALSKIGDRKGRNVGRGRGMESVTIRGGG